MLIYILKRLYQAIFVLLGVLSIVFFLLHLSGDPTQLLLPLDATSEERAAFRDQMGFNDPLLYQYANFLLNVVQGDLGYSYRHSEPAIGLVLERIPATFELTVASLLIAIGVAIPLGVVAAVKRGTLIDSVAMGFSLLGQATPVYWLGLLLILLFSVKLGVLPTGGRDGFETLILPAFTLAVFSMARIARITRSGMLDVLGQDYIRTARAKGISEWTIISNYALRNAAIPLVTVIGLEFGVLLGGAVITETIFSWPGVGRFAIDSIFARDYPVVQAIVMVLSAIFVLVNLAVDILYTYLDPRIREGGAFK
ncbi:nickel ABC transporter permease [Castellaniella sp. S9]|uniref:nickel ABC transporter permease n=1 Tax=Castellaniella sp. S9 TaxID=2993652 RepID=UPI0022B483BC|nr:nickel ABC transporter permease [Castellaniella sp. S9]